MTDEVPLWFKIIFYILLYFVIFPVCAIASILLFVNILQFIFKLLKLFI